MECSDSSGSDNDGHGNENDQELIIIPIKNRTTSSGEGYSTENGVILYVSNSSGIELLCRMSSMYFLRGITFSILIVSDILIFYQGSKGNMVKGKWTHSKKGHWHQGRPHTLASCVNHYNEWRNSNEKIFGKMNEFRCS